MRSVAVIAFRRAAAMSVVACACLALSTGAVAEAPADQQPVSFARDIAPIFMQRCLACHGEDEAESDYRLDSFERLQTAGASGEEAIVAGKPDESLLYQLLSTDDEDARMPMDGDAIPSEELALVERWIAAGATYDGGDAQLSLASIVPLRTHPSAPEVYPHTLPITALAFSPDATRLVASGYYEVTVWNPVDGALVARIGNVAERTFGLAFSPDGALLAVASGIPGELGEVRLYRTADGTVERDLVAMADVALAVRFNPAGDRVAACGADRSIRIFDVASGQEQVTIEEHADWVQDVAWNNDGTRLASASRDNTAKIFDTASGESLATFSGHGQPVYAVTFSADGAKVFSAGADSRVRVWNVADGKQQAEITGFGSDVVALAIAGGHLVSGSADKSVRQHNAADHVHVRDLTSHADAGHDDWVQAIAVHEASGLAASGSHDGRVIIWRLDDGEPIANFIASPGLSAGE
jgi:dipeptidyl aminopeptidase/acylaminoacyl peptidase